jgi:large subunit ribosomal protein L29
MELTKIRNLTNEELKSEQAKAAEQLFRIRFQKSLGNTEGIKKLRTLKLDIARIHTVARERELDAQPATPAAAAPPPSRKKAKTAPRAQKAQKD